MHQNMANRFQLILHSMPETTNKWSFHKLHIPWNSEWKNTHITLHHSDCQIQQMTNKAFIKGLPLLLWPFLHVHTPIMSSLPPT